MFKSSISFLKDMKDAGLEKIGSLANDVLEVAPLLDGTGFIMKDISVDVGVPPGIGVTFSKVKDGDPQVVEQMMAENKDGDLLKLIVRSLQQADEMQRATNLKDYKFAGISMRLGLPPDMTLRYVRVDGN